MPIVRVKNASATEDVQLAWYYRLERRPSQLSLPRGLIVLYPEHELHHGIGDGSDDDEMEIQRIESV